MYCRVTRKVVQFCLCIRPLNDLDLFFSSHLDVMVAIWILLLWRRHIMPSLLSSTAHRRKRSRPRTWQIMPLLVLIVLLPSTFYWSCPQISISYGALDWLWRYVKAGSWYQGCPKRTTGWSSCMCGIFYLFFFLTFIYSFKPNESQIFFAINFTTNQLC